MEHDCWHFLLLFEKLMVKVVVPVYRITAECTENYSLCCFPRAVYVIV
jgi:hypothetical protein